MAPATHGTIRAADGTLWPYDIAVLRDGRLMWLLRSPGGSSWRARTAGPCDTVGTILARIRETVDARSAN